MPTDRPAAVIGELSATVDYLRITVGGPTDAWLQCAPLVSDPEVLGALIASTKADRGTDQDDVATSLFVQGYAFRVASTAIGVWLLGDIVLDVAPANTSIAMGRARPNAVRLDVATAKESASISDLHAELVDGHLAPLVATAHRTCRVGDALLWGNVAASCVAVLRCRRRSATGPAGRGPRPGRGVPGRGPAGGARRRTARPGRRAVRVGAAELLPVVPDGVGLSLRGLLAVFRPGPPGALRRHARCAGRPMILFGSNADTELLAIRSAWDDLPDDLGEVRWFHPTGSTGFPSLDGRRARGGASARRGPPGRTGSTPCGSRARARGVPLVASGGEACSPIPSCCAASTVPAGVAARGALATSSPEARRTWPTCCASCPTRCC